MTNNSCSMIIPITGDSSAGDNEWTILELNGELIVPVELPSEDKPQTRVLGPDQVELGALHFQDEKTTKLILGSHELKGTIEHLKQPFCVFEKQRGCTTEGTDAEHQSDLQYKVAGVITKKLLFNNYPKTIMRSWVTGLGLTAGKLPARFTSIPHCFLPNRAFVGFNRLATRTNTVRASQRSACFMQLFTIMKVKREAFEFCFYNILQLYSCDPSRNEVLLRRLMFGPTLFPSKEGHRLLHYWTLTRGRTRTDSCAWNGIACEKSLL